MSLVFGHLNSEIRTQDDHYVYLSQLPAGNDDHFQEESTSVEFGADHRRKVCIELRRLTSTGLKRTALKLSTPQVKERIGLLLFSSQMSTCWPHVANTASFWWWSRPVVTSPSQEPESRVERLLVCLAMQLTPSLCPSREARKGLANTLSSLVAFRARVYSLLTSNGCRVGS
ncbi:hypothetical protein EYF80_025213 [Liparis tanakae]|uniref:Uncharacterized protein n=1 Tax=Liparis tanakae TaxID=230148 RepID=A0A4Z2HFT9_9TELE|nr:hypothetical protein EYF80_025213 [Liparis tanakae]